MFIIDEAYYGYSNVESASSLIGQYQNIVVTRTFSKLYGLAGLRIGYLLASKENIKNLSVLVNEKNVTSLVGFSRFHRTSLSIFTSRCRQ
jgi:histidinol-phosphate aminotransferase